MKAIDTNVLARFFVDDEEDRQVALQRPLAVAALSQPCWVSLTVVLEFEWVLRGFYELSAKEIARVMLALAGIGHVEIEDRHAVLLAVEAASRGMDFADALHIARSSQATSFVSFDRKLAKKAASLGLQPPVELLKAH